MPYPGGQSAPLTASTQQSDGDDDFGSQLSGLFWEDVGPSEDYKTVPRGTGLLQIPGNAFHNLADWGQGFATMGSVLGARTLEVASGQPLFRQTDIDDTINFAKAVLEDYNTGYIEPLKAGNLGAIYDRFAMRPLDVASDALMLAPGAKAVSKLSGVAKASEALSAGAANTGRRLFGHLEQRALGADGLIGDAARTLSEYRIRKQIVGESAKEAHAQFIQDQAELEAARKNLSAHEFANLRGKLEGWDPEVLRGQAMSEGMENYHQVAGNLAVDNEFKLDGLGHVTQDQVWREKWKPLVKQWFRSVYGVESDIDLAKLPKDKLAKLIHAVATYFQKKGVKPVNVPRMKEGNIRNVLENPGEIEPWMLSHQMRNAGIKGGVGESVMSPFEYERTALETGAEFSPDAHSSILARRLQVLQAHSLLTNIMKEVMSAAQDVRNLTPEQIAAFEASPNWTRFEAQKFFGKIMDSNPITTGFDTAEVIPKLFAAECFIPTPLAKAFTNPKVWKTGSLEKGLQGFANFARRYILGFNLLWPEKQFGQNLLMLGLFQFRGPLDTLVSFASYTLTKDPRVRALVPEIIKGEAFAADAASPAFGGALGKAQAVVEKGVDFTFQRGQFYDRLSRTVAGVYYALKVSEKPEFAGPIRGMLTTGEAINRMEQVFANTKYAADVNQKVIKVLGDYSRLAAKQRQVLRSLLLWWMWYEHIVKYAVALPANAPYKTALLSAIAETHTRLREDAEGMPEGLKKAGAVKLEGMENEQDIPLYTMGGSLNPFTTLTELVEFVRQPVEGAESSTIIGAMNPVFTYGFMLTGMNPQTGRGFRDPRMVALGGRQYKYEDLERGLLKEQEPRPLMAGGLEYAVRIFFPQPARLAERLFAKATTGGEPSQFTSVLSGEAAPRVVYDSGGEPLAAGSYWDIVKEAMLGQRAFPIDESATLQNDSINPARLRKALRAAGRQIDLNKED